jgi:hypothetical protein
MCASFFVIARIAALSAASASAVASLRRFV